jgi:ankyrin repeat protein
MKKLLLFFITPFISMSLYGSAPRKDAQKNTQLENAAYQRIKVQCNHIDRTLFADIGKLLEKKLDNIHKKYGILKMPLITCAVTTDMLCLVEKVLSHADVKVDATDIEGQTALCTALQGAQMPSIIKALLNKGANPNHNVPGMGTPIRFAAMCQNWYMRDSKDLVKGYQFLCDANADINFSMNEHTTLFYAIQNRNYPLVKFLRKNGAQISEKEIQEALGESLFDRTFIATDKRSLTEAAKTLDLYKQLTKAALAEKQESAQATDKSGQDQVNAKSSCATQLTQAQSHDLGRILSETKKNLDLFIQHSKGAAATFRTALNIDWKEIQKYCENKPDLFSAICKLVYQKEGDVNAEYESITFLGHAVIINDYTLVKLILEKKPEIDATMDTSLGKRHTALTFACMIGAKPSIIKALLDAGANANHRDNSQKTPLMCAALCQKWFEKNIDDLLLGAQHLLNNGAQINAIDKDGDSALIFAIQTFYSPFVEFLIKKCIPDVDASQINKFLQVNESPNDEAFAALLEIDIKTIQENRAKIKVILEGALKLQSSSTQKESQDDQTKSLLDQIKKEQPVLQQRLEELHASSAKLSTILATYTSKHKTSATSNDDTETDEEDTQKVLDKESAEQKTLEKKVKKKKGRKNPAATGQRSEKRAAYLAKRKAKREAAKAKSGQEKTSIGSNSISSASSSPSLVAVLNNTPATSPSPTAGDSASSSPAPAMESQLDNNAHTLAVTRVEPNDPGLSPEQMRAIAARIKKEKDQKKKSEADTKKKLESLSKSINELTLQVNDTHITLSKRCTLAEQLIQRHEKVKQYDQNLFSKLKDQRTSAYAQRDKLVKQMATAPAAIPAPAKPTKKATNSKAHKRNIVGQPQFIRKGNNELVIIKPWNQSHASPPTNSASSQSSAAASSITSPSIASTTKLVTEIVSPQNTLDTSSSAATTVSSAALQTARAQAVLSGTKNDHESASIGELPKPNQNGQNSHLSARAKPFVMPTHHSVVTNTENLDDCNYHLPSDLVADINR